MKHILCQIFAVLVWLTLFLRLGLVAVEAEDAGNSALWAVLCSFQYFTLTTTLLAALVLSAVVWRPASWLAGPVWSGMVCASLVLVALVYTLMLRHLWEPEGLRKVVDIFLHDIIPPLFFVYWLVFASRLKLAWHTLLIWLAYPVSYLLAIMWLGNATGSYPYPFLQVGELGLMRVLLNSLGLLVFYLSLGASLLGISHLVRQYTSRR